MLLVSPSNVGVPRLVCGGPVEWRGCVCRVLSPLSYVVPVLFAVFPVFELDPALCIVQFPLHCIPLVSCCPLPLCVVVLLCYVRRTEGRRGGVIVNVVFLFISLLPLCLLSQHVGLGLCLCDSVVSLWNGGDGLRWVERRAVWGGYCLHTTLL